MRRLAAAVTTVALLAGACSSDSDKRDDAAPSTTSSSTAQGPSTTGAATAVSCDGLGAAPAEGSAEITWIGDDGRLWAVAADKAGTSSAEKRCLLDGAEAEDGVAWGGDADRVLVRGKVVFADGRTEEPFPPGGITVLSRPTGTSVLNVQDGRLRKRELGGDRTDITFLSGHGDTIYHPAGRHIVSTGTEDGRSILHIADNRGQGSQALVENETADLIYNPAFTASGALLFVADHGSYTELHRLEIDAGELSTIVREDIPDGIADLVTSPFQGGGVAWSQGVCDIAKGGRRLRAQRSGEYFKTEGTAVERAEPLGWTPDGGIVVATPGFCDAEGEVDPATIERVLYLFKDGVATEVTRGVQTAAVRAVLPPPPAPPKSIPQQAPA